ncbi:gamma-glutamyltransferase [Labrenzia sp. OB1]|uniref:gamma-glutamyltransferase n=1 Tax=Labrenzia sp. OB1 TaxID=1561204 RepID=UPI001FCABA27|nr:gamma-glutamyltransferase [Labrenzia sp. OB1]
MHSVNRDFQMPGRSPVHAREAMASTSHPLATSAALEVLQGGGNAVDAAIAAVAVQCVVEPHMTGIGGDCFAIVMEPDGRLTGFNGSGAAPRAATPQKLAELGVTQITDTSPHAVTVPGAIRAWETLLKAHGTRDFKPLFSRAIRYARDGFPVAPRVAHDWMGEVGKLAGDPLSAASYLVDGKAPKVGTILKYPRLADTLEKVAEGGADAFYGGDIADDIVTALRSRGGLMTRDDLAACHTTAVSPVLRDYKGHTIAELPPNGQGIIALVMLGLLERFDLEKMDPLGAERFHLEMEAARLAYGVRDRFVTDPGYMDVCHSHLIGEDYLDRLAKQISAGGRMASVPHAQLAPQTDTVYLTVVDKDGLAVSLINSLFSSFGSGIVAPESGVLLHCRGKSFKAEPGHANSIDGGKRPMHTIIPAMALKDGAPWLSFGVMGGQYQACGHAHVLTNIIDYGMDVQAAIDFPRMFFNMDSHELEAEHRIPSLTLDGLKALGHSVVSAPEAIGGSQAIMIDKPRRLLTAGSDPRKDGHAAGY